jgi:hypothetical protein
MDKPKRNQHCIKDGKPCVPAGDGGCMACDDCAGNYNQSPVDIDSATSIFDRHPIGTLFQKQPDGRILAMGVDGFTSSGGTVNE